MTTAPKDKAFGQDETAEVSAGAAAAQARTLPEGGDVVSSVAVKVAQRRALMELLSTPGVMALDDPDVMAGAWR